MLQKLSLALITGSLLLGISSCKKENILPRNSAPNEFETAAGVEKNNGSTYFTRCPEMQKTNAGADIFWIAGKANDPSEASYGVDNVAIYILDWTAGPPPAVDGFTIDEFTYSEDGLYQIFQTPNNFFLFDPTGPSPVGHTYTILTQALDVNGVVIESMECSVKITEPFQKAPKGVKTKVIERNNGTADLQVVVNPRDYIVLDWKSTDQLVISYDQVSTNPILHAGNEYTLDFAGMKPNGNLLFKTTLTGALEYSPSVSTSIENKFSITEEQVDPSEIYLYRSATQENITCSGEGMMLIDKGLNSYVNTINAILNNDGTVTINVKRSQKALLANNNDIYYARLTISNIQDPTLQLSYDRYEWDYDGDGTSNYPQAYLEELHAGMWDFDGDDLNDYEPKLRYKFKKRNLGYLKPNTSVWVNDVYDARVEFFDRSNNSMGFVEQLITIE